MKQRVYLLLAISTVMLCMSTTECMAADIAGYRHTQYFNDRDNILSHTQVWGISSAGGKLENYLFLATNEGLFMYNGIRMESLRKECSKSFRTVKYDQESGRLYSAGVNSFGWWDSDCYGVMKYHELFNNPEFRSSSYDFWRIGFAGKGEDHRVYFQCREKIAVYNPSDDSIMDLLPKQYFRYLHQAEDNLYYQDGNVLCSFSNERSSLICEVGERIVNIVQSPEGLIAALENTGLVIIGEDGHIDELDKGTNRILKSAKITDCQKYDDRHLLIGTTMHGIFVTDMNGVIDDSIRINDMLSNSTVLCISSDHNGNIWVGQDSGVAMIDNSSSDYYLSDNRFGQVHAIIKTDNGELLIGSNKGLFIIDKTLNVKHLPIQTGAVWNIFERCGNIFIAHDKGLSLLTESLELIPLYRDTGVFCMHGLHSDADRYILGTYGGLALIELSQKDNSIISLENINYKGFTRHIAIDAYDRIWVTIPQTGFVRLTIDKTDWIVKEEVAYDLASSPNREVFSTTIDDRLFLCTMDSAYDVDNPDGEPIKSKGAEGILQAAGKDVKSLIQCGNRFWYISSQGYGYVERAGTDLIRHHGLLKYAKSERVMNVSPLGDECAIGYKNGIGFCYGDTGLKNRIQISKVVAQGSRKNLLHDLSSNTFIVPSSNNTISIYVSCSIPESNNIQYRLSSKSEDWETFNIALIPQSGLRKK
ncbi:MAG: two-component regulator propeller domain-containing protein [Candidatus Cryptobacteroides sp.]